MDKDNRDKSCNMDNETKQNLKGWLALSPLAVFLCLYLVTSLILNDFYAVPITVAFLVSSIFAIATTGGLRLSERIQQYSKGAGDKNIILMIWIFIMAGAFAQSAKTMGAIDATVNLTLSILPGEFLLGGIFLAACFISLSVGTSVGTIAALTPVAIGLAERTGIDLPYMIAVVAGGSFFGDNLSFISDTTIAATTTQHCQMRDKFRVNILIVLPAAIVTLALYFVKGFALNVAPEVAAIEWIKVLHYLLVLVAALLGMNVMAVLFLGIVATGAIGLLTGGMPFSGWLQAMGEGILGMSELIIVTLLAGGMLELIRHNGGIDFIISRLMKRISGKRGAEFTIAALVSLANLCTANNTIAILTIGPLAHQISEKYGLNSKRTASILDTFSCLMQSLIPYGAQMLIAAGLAQISPTSIIENLYYPMCMGVCAVLAIIFRYPRVFA